MPNVDAVTFFVRDVLPLIQAAEPGIRFIIAGANPTDEVRALARDDIIVTGMIDDLRDLFDTVRVFVCPLRFGAGMKGKILTAMSYGVPVVTTGGRRRGNRGAGRRMRARRRRSRRVRRRVRCGVYRDQALWNTLSENGLALVRDCYSLDSGKELLRHAIDTGFRRLLGIDTSNSGEREAEAAE